MPGLLRWQCTDETSALGDQAYVRASHRALTPAKKEMGKEVKDRKRFRIFIFWPKFRLEMDVVSEINIILTCY